MKSASLKVLTLALAAIACSCQKSEEKTALEEKKLAVKCPRVAAIQDQKEQPLYKVTTYAGASVEDHGIYKYGLLCDAVFGGVAGIAFSGGSIFLTDEYHGKISVISDKGEVSLFAGHEGNGTFGRGFNDGIGIEAGFQPAEINPAKNGDLYVLDQIIGEATYGTVGFALRKVTPAKEVTTLINLVTDDPSFRGFLDGNLSEAKFNYMSAIAVDSDNSIFIADAGNNVIRKISPDGLVSTYAGVKPVDSVRQKGYRDGIKENALFETVTDIAFGNDGSLYVCDKGNKNIRRITKQGIVETLADVDAFKIALDIDGTIYASNYSKIFRISSGSVSLVAGSDAPGYKDGIGTAAKFGGIDNMAISGKYLYIAESHYLRRMTIK